MLNQHNANWDILPEIVKKAQADIGYGAFQQAEIYWSRLSIMLAEKLMPVFLNAKTNQFKIDNYFILGLFIHAIILKGKTTWISVLDDPQQSFNHQADFVKEDALYSYAFFRYQMLYNLAGKLRLNSTFRTPVADSEILPGFSRMVTFATTLFENSDEQYPELYCDPKDGSWLINGQPA